MSEQVENKIPEESKIEEPKMEEPKMEENPLLHKFKKEKDNWKNRAAEMEAELNRIKNERLKEKEDYKALYESSEERYNLLKNDYETKNKMIHESNKRNSLRTELERMGCQREYLDKALKFANMENISYDDETGTVTGHIEVAKSLSEELRPFFSHSSPGVDQAAPVGGPNDMTVEAYKNLSPEERKKAKPQLYKNLGIIR